MQGLWLINYYMNTVIQFCQNSLLSDNFTSEIAMIQSSPHSKTKTYNIRTLNMRCKQHIHTMMHVSMNQQATRSDVRVIFV